MSWTDVKGYFQAVLENEGYSEHDDPFDSANIPGNIIDKAFFIDFGPFTGVTLSMKDLETRVPVSISVFVKGFNSPVAARDAGIQIAETIVKEAVRPTKRLIFPITNVNFLTADFTPLSADNDQVVVVTMNFTVRILLDIVN